MGCGANCLRATALLLAMSTEGQQSSERADQYSLGMAIRVAAWLAAAIFFTVAAFQAALVSAPRGASTRKAAGRAVHSPPRDGSLQQCRACSRS